jgi:hypothetical protein
MDGEIAHTPGQEPQPNNSHPNDFPVRMADVVGERLRFRRCEPRESHIHELMSIGGRVGSVSLFGSSRLALVACAEGSMSLTKRRQCGWQLLIRRPDGKNLGLYSGRRWLSGGTIILTSGVEVGLEHGVLGMWTIHSLASHERLASLRAGSRLRDRELGMTMASSVARRDEFPLVVLVACAVVMLDQSVTGVASAAGAGSSTRRPITGTGPVGADSIGQ